MVGADWGHPPPIDGSGVAYLAHAGETGVVGDDTDEDFLALVGAVLVIGS